MDLLRIIPWCCVCACASDGRDFFGPPVTIVEGDGSGGMVTAAAGRVGSAGHGAPASGTGGTNDEAPDGDSAGRVSHDVAGSGGTAMEASGSSSGGADSAGTTTGGGEAGAAELSPSGGSSGSATGAAGAGLGGRAETAGWGGSGSGGLAVAAGAGGASAGTVSSGGESTGGKSAGGSAGSAGTELLDCGHKVTLHAGLLTDFETYDGNEPASGFAFSFDGGDSPATGTLTKDDDGSGAYSLAFIERAAGHAVSGKNTLASNWGGGVILALHCLDARSFTGVRFRIKGSTPAGTAEVGLTANQGTKVGHQFEMPAEWTLFSIPFASFEGIDPTPAATTKGDAITAITFSSQLHYTQDPVSKLWEPDPGAFEVSVDDVGFY